MVLTFSYNNAMINTFKKGGLTVIEIVAVGIAIIAGKYYRRIIWYGENGELRALYKSIRP